MKRSKQRPTLCCLLILMGSLVAHSLGTSTLYSSSRFSPAINYVAPNEALIQRYEQDGDYGAALEIALTSYQESLNSGFLEEAALFLKLVKRLEEELLTLGCSRLLFDEHHEPRAKVLDLLRLMGMEPLNKSQKSILQINQWAQKNLLRQGERWEEQASRFESLNSKILPILSELGFIKTSVPHFREYDGVLLHGGLLPRVRLRLHYLVEQWKSGIRFSHLYFLSGERPLDGQEENRKAFFEPENSPLKVRKGWLEPAEFPKTECEMIRFIWDQSEVPEAMRTDVEVHFINAPMKKSALTEKLLRPTTDDTVEYWLKQSPAYGTYLAISHAPYRNRQDLVVRNLVPKEYRFETVGYGASEEEKISIYLDEFARYVFQMKQASEK